MQLAWSELRAQRRQVHEDHGSQPPREQSRRCNSGGNWAIEKARIAGARKESPYGPDPQLAGATGRSQVADTLWKSSLRFGACAANSEMAGRPSGHFSANVSSDRCVRDRL